MKKAVAAGILICVFLVSAGITQKVHAQGVLDRLEKKVEKKVEQRVDRKVDSGIDKQLNKAEDKVDGATTKKDKKDNKKSSKTADNGKSSDKKNDNTPPDTQKPKRVNAFASQAAAADEGASEAASVRVQMAVTEEKYAMAHSKTATTEPIPPAKTPVKKDNTKTDNTPPPAVTNNTAGNDKPANNTGGTMNNNMQPKTTPVATTENPATESDLKVRKDNSANNNKAILKASKQWADYDFVPGELVIFSDNQFRAQDGEFPSDFKLVKGSAEYTDLGTVKAVSFLGIPTEIAPKMKTEAFLPAVFTVEFDAYFHNESDEAYVLKFKGMEDIEAHLNSVVMGDFNGYTTDNMQKEAWRHIAVVFNSRGMKMYIDQHRVVNIPQVEMRPSSFTIYSANDGAKTGDRAMIKNFRLFDASLSPMDRFMRDGKLVSRGITFVPGTAEMKPESSGTLNMIAKMMKEDPALNLNIEAHVDKTGAPSSELQDLTAERARVVQSALVGHGINSARLTSKGWGDFKPVDSNDTAAGRENNRRIEFIKQ